jgi:hypothetical protein
MSSVRNWSQMVRNADPDFDRESRRPWVYEFSNGRRFLDPPQLYAPGALFILDDGASRLDDEGRVLAGPGPTPGNPEDILTTESGETLTDASGEALRR